METDQALSQYNDFTNNLAQTLNPSFIRQKTKDLVGNMLLMFGVPFFLGRLEKHLGGETAGKIGELLKDPNNIVNNSKAFAQKLFTEKVLQPVKNQVLDEASKFVPELKNLDLEKATLGDLQNAFKDSVLNKMKNNLPKEIADQLPENFTRDDILNSLKNIGSDQALNFAKKNLPAEAYQELENNRSLLTDPGKIADFMKNKLSDVEQGFGSKINDAKEFASQKLAEVKDTLSNQLDELTQPFKDKLNDLNSQRQALSDQYQNTINDLNDKFNNAKQALRDYKSNNPGAGEDELSPLNNAIKDIQQQARDARQGFNNTADDLDEQIQGAQSLLESKTSQALDSLTKLRNTATESAQNAIENTKQSLSDAIQEPMQSIQEAISQPLETLGGLGEEASGFMSGFRSFAQSLRTKATNFLNPTTPQPSIAEGGQGYSMVDPLELDGTWTENALKMAGISSNPVLNSYFGSEAEGALSKASELVSNLVKKSASTIEKVSSVTKRPKITRNTDTEPQFLDQEEAQRVLSTGLRGARPIEVLPRAPSSAPQIARQEAQAAQQAAERAQPTPQEPTQPTVEPESAPVPEDLPMFEGLSEAPAQSIAPVSEGVSAPGASASSLAPEAEQVLAKTAATTGEDVGEQIASKVGQTAAKTATSSALEGLDAAAGASEGIPILGTILDVAGLLGSIFGAGALMKDKAPAPPIVEGTSFEPGL
jgi:hypothetical protein